MLDDEGNNGTELGFWPRQFSSEINTGQLFFDVMFGIVLPILSFIFDPIVFTGDQFFVGFVSLTPYKAFVYLFSFFSIAVLAIWLLAPRAVKNLGGFIGGVLLSGAMLSSMIGVLILPITLIGLMFLIGILGFIPFFTAFTYLRNGVRAFKASQLQISKTKLVNSLLLGAVLIIAVPFVVSTTLDRMVTKSLDDLVRGNPQQMETAVGRLKYLGWLADSDRIVWAYEREPDQTRKQVLARAYREMTSQDIERRLAILND